MEVIEWKPASPKYTATGNVGYLKIDCTVSLRSILPFPMTHEGANWSRREIARQIWGCSCLAVSGRVLNHSSMFQHVSKRWIICFHANSNHLDSFLDENRMWGTIFSFAYKGTPYQMWRLTPAQTMLTIVQAVPRKIDHLGASLVVGNVVKTPLGQSCICN